MCAPWTRDTGAAMKHSTPLLLLLAACTEPPPVAVASLWETGVCGDTIIKVEVTTEPGLEVTLDGSVSQLTATANTAGVAAFSLAPEDWQPFSAVAAHGDKVTREVVVGPPSRIINTTHPNSRGGAPMFSNRCRTPGTPDPACGVGPVGGELQLGGGAPDGSVIRHGGAEATVGQTPGMASVPIAAEAVTYWNLADLHSGGPCPHVAVPGVEVEVRGVTYRGEAWLGAQAANDALANVLAGAFDGHAVGEAPTADAALVVSRFSDTATLHRFERWEGTPAKVSDVAWIVRSTRSTRDAGSCGMYRSERGQQVEVFQQATDLHLELVERATGRKLAEQTVQGRPSGCGPLAFGSVQASEPPTAATDAWVTAELGKAVRELNAGG